VKSMNTLSDLAYLPGDIPPHAVGSWFLLNEDQLRLGARSFSNHGGPRPCVLSRRPTGPNAILFARTTTGSRGTCHAEHTDHDVPPCCVTRPGRVLTTTPLLVNSSTITAEAFGCCEPTDSPLLRILERRCR
jgi:hypothetical protein